MRIRRPSMVSELEQLPPGQHRWSVLVEYPITRQQAGAVVAGAELELGDQPIALAVVCHVCEQPYAFVEGKRCEGAP